MDIKELYFKLGVAQAEANLPLAYYDVNNVAFSGEARTKALNAAQQVVNAVKQHILDTTKVEATSASLFDYHLSSGYVLVEGAKIKKKADEETLMGIELLMATSNPPMVHANYTWNHNGGQGQPIPERIMKATVERHEGLHKTEEVGIFLHSKLLKLNPVTNKITSGRVPTKVVSFIPFEQVQGYVQTLQQKMKNNVIKITYRKTNGQTRQQYVTASVPMLQAVYQGQHSMVTRYYDASLPSSTLFLGKETPFTVINGTLQLPDVGLSNFADTIMRKINLGAILDIEVIDTPNHEDLYELSKYTDVDLSQVQGLFNVFISEMPQEDRVKLWSVLQADAQTPNTGLDKNKLLVEELLRYSSYFVMLNSTTALKRLHTIMTIHTDLFPEYNNGKSTQSKETSTQPKAADTFGTTTSEEINF